MEPAIAFRLIREQRKINMVSSIIKELLLLLMRKKGALRELSLEEGYRSFIVPDNVGGRYSGYLRGLGTLYLAGIDINELLSGADSQRSDI